MCNKIPRVLILSIIEWMELEGTLKMIQLQAPAMDRATFQ